MQTLLDAFKLALFNEVKARAFYRRAAEVTRYNDARLWLLSLAGLEEDHAHAIARRVGGDSFAAGFDARGYIDELQDTLDSVLTPEEEAVVLEGERSAVFDLAKSMELTASEIYHAMAEGIADPELAQFFFSLSRQERGHYEELLKIEHTLRLVAGEAGGE
jgi:rubrerythrin